MMSQQNPAATPQEDDTARAIVNGESVGGRLRAALKALTLRRVWSDAAVRSALFAFALTRLIILMVFVITTHFEIPNPPQTIDDYKNPNIVVHKDSLRPRVARLADYGDGGWYMGIARDGYEQRPFADTGQHNWAFFPLFPLLLRAVSNLTGGVALTGMALSSLLFLLALILLYKTIVAFGYDEAIADRALFYLAAFPVSYFFSLPMTESLFLLLTVGSFYAARREAWWTAGALGALASATRVTGVILLPALCVLYWQQHRGRLRVDILKLLLIPLGLLAFMYYLDLITGDALAFRHVLGSWGRQSGFFLRPLFEFLRHPQELSMSWDFRLLNFAAAVLALTCGAALAKRREWALSLYTLAGIIIPLSSQLLQSHARYVMVIFPLFIILAWWGRNPRVDQTIRAAFLVLLGLMSALFAAHFSTAMS
ncbi:MAG TPA: mannosyltransferase family protein [Pyrinomonadaceae bacterium]